jgi:hypothetical protein
MTETACVVVIVRDDQDTIKSMLDGKDLANHMTLRDRLAVSDQGRVGDDGVPWNLYAWEWVIADDQVEQLVNAASTLCSTLGADGNPSAHLMVMGEGHNEWHEEGNYTTPYDVHLSRRIMVNGSTDLFESFEGGE